MPEYSLGKYYETITEFVSKLDYDWFQKKEAKFKKEEFYNPKKERLFIANVQPASRYNIKLVDGKVEIGDEIVASKKTIDIDLRRYCSCYLPIDEITDWGIWEFDDEPFSRRIISDNILEVVADLVKRIASFSEDLHDVVAISNYVSTTISKISDEINELKKSNKNKVFHEILNDFLNECSGSLYRRYEKALTVHELTVNYSDKLDFNLTQEELVSLLYILADAEILPDKYYHQFLHFCFKYFQVQKRGGFISLTNKRTFIETYSRILRGENGEGLSKIKKKLAPVLKGII
jgi:hypothetical protein